MITRVSLDLNGLGSLRSRLFVDTVTMPGGKRRGRHADRGRAIAGLAADLGGGRGARPARVRLARIPVRTGQKRGRGHWLLVRRSVSDPAETAYYACYGPRRSSMADLAWIAGSRWHIGGVPAAGQGRGRTRSVPGAVLAGLVCPHHVVNARAGLAGGQPGPGRKKGIGTSDPGMIGYTLPEIRRLLISLVQAYAADPEDVWRWVPLASATAVPGPAMPLPAPRLCTHLSGRRVASSAVAGPAENLTGDVDRCQPGGW